MFEAANGALSVAGSQHEGPARTYGETVRFGSMFVTKTHVAQLCVGLADRGEISARLTDAEALLKAGFDPSESRDSNGLWTTGGTGGGASSSGGNSVPVSGTSTPAGGVAIPAIGPVSAPGAGGAGWLFEAAKEILSGLAEISAVGAIAYFGLMLLPLRRSPVANGNLPDHPDIGFLYDGDTGQFGLYRNQTQIFSGTALGDGIIRDSAGNPVGRRVDDTVVIDSDALSQVLAANAQEKDDANARAAAAAIAIPKTEPRLCPAPAPDRPGDKSPDALAYENFIHELVNPETPTPSDFAVYLLNPMSGKLVSFDDCDLANGDMVDAKGYRYERLLPWSGAEADLIEQATRQVLAAGPRKIIWYFAEQGAADHVRRRFAQIPGLDRIHIIFMPMPLNKLELYPNFGSAYLAPGVEIYWQLSS